MGKLENALVTLRTFSIGNGFRMPGVAFLLVTLLYLGLLLSVPLRSLSTILWLGVYPVVCSEMTRVGFGTVLKKSLWVLPFVLLIGVFNPYFERTEYFQVGTWRISIGWISFMSLTLRGLFAVQSVLIITGAIGFYSVCRSMRKIGIPKMMVSQVLLTFRYLEVLGDEVITMKQTRMSRGYGRESYPFREWGIFIGQLLLRSIDRATRIQRSLEARGFNGLMPEAHLSGKSELRRGLFFMIGWTILLMYLRFVNISIL